MTPVLVATFFVLCFVLYALMMLVCIIKRKYCQAENVLCKVIEAVECAPCREACQNHSRLIVRAVMFSAAITFVAWIVLLILRHAS